MTKMLFISAGTEKYPQLFDISHVIIASVVSEIRPKARITLPPLLSILKQLLLISTNKDMRGLYG